MAERKWKKISTWMAAWVMAVVFAVSGAQTAFAATSYVNSVSITLDVTPTVGESLPILMWDTILITARYRSRTTINMISYPQSGLPQRTT